MVFARDHGQHSSPMAETLHHYFAYGANMDERQMSSRCPCARLVCAARLPEHRFLINRQGYASIAEAPGRTVYGLLWTITRQDEQSLDRYEAVEEGFYRRVVLAVVCDRDGGGVEALVYVASDDVEGIPRPRYFQGILRAAPAHGFPPEYIAELESWGARKTIRP